VERWRAEGSETRLLVQRKLGASARATVVAVRENFDGNGSRSDLDGIAFVGRDGRTAVEADVRWAFGSVWSTALVAGVAEAHHARTDFAAELLTDINTRTPFVAAEVGRLVGQTWLATGASAAAQVPLGSALPDATKRGPNYQRLIAPDLGYALAEARAQAWWIAALVPLSGSTFTVGVRSERTQSRTPGADRLQPDGDRTAWSVTVGVRR
jgi:hypothetical protein